MPSPSFGHCLESWISVQSVTCDFVQARFGLPQCAPVVQARLVGAGEPRLQEVRGNNRAGVIRFGGLEPETDYTLTVTVGEDSCDLPFRTLPRPRRPLLFRMAILADPHVSCRAMDVYGRLHPESGDLLHLALRGIQADQCDLILMPGDVTDEGRPEEYDLAAGILAETTVPYYLTPGNHDLEKDVEHRFQQLFGIGAWHKSYRGFQLVALDTGDAILDKPWNHAAAHAIDLEIPLIAFTHCQLWPDAWIPDANRAIADADTPGAQAILRKLAQCHGVLYVGHKNIASEVRIGSLVQLNTPQTSHFPAGYLVADVHADGIWHRFVPMGSEALNEYSRLGTEASRPFSHPDCACKSAFRDRFTQQLWNQVIHL
jgi:hypothetical protein